MAKQVKLTTDVRLDYVVIKEGGKFVAYIPALDMSTSANTFDQAHKRAEELAQIFFEETAKRGALEKALDELGWKKARSKGGWLAPHIVAQNSYHARVPIPA